MGLISTTGQQFKFKAPDVSIDFLSSNTGEIGTYIDINGQNLDYINQVKLNTELCGFVFKNINLISFIVPENGSTGNLNIFSDYFNLTGTNPQEFYPIYRIDDFSPKSGPSGTIIGITGKYLNTLSGVYFGAIPILDDIEYAFSGYLNNNKNSFYVLGSSSSGIANTSMLQNINKKSEFNDPFLINKDYGDFSTGIIFDIKYQKELQQKVYELHFYNFQTGSLNDNLVSLTTGVTGKSNFIDFPSGLFNTLNYSVYNTILNTGNNIYTSYISGKNFSGFYINFDSDLNYQIICNLLLVRNNTFLYDSGTFSSNSIFIDTGINYLRETFVDSRRYAPYIITSAEYSGNGSGYIYNLSDINNEGFDLNILNTLSSGEDLKINYLTIYAPSGNLNTFVAGGSESYYKKIYLLSGNENNLIEKISGKNFQILNNNSGTVEVPYSEYHIFGPLFFEGIINKQEINNRFNNYFFETPDPTGIFPDNITEGSVIISGKSFKKNNLLDGTGDYNYIAVKFRYINDPKEKNNFFGNFSVIDSQTLSGDVFLKNYLTGQYVIQLLGEDGSIYE